MRNDGSFVTETDKRKLAEAKAGTRIVCTKCPRKGLKQVAQCKVDAKDCGSMYRDGRLD